MRRLPLVLACLALAGCGGGRSDAELVRETVTGFGEAIAAKDYGRLCEELLADDLLASLEEIGLPCRIALEGAYGRLEDPRLVVGAIEVDGAKATAEIRTSAKGEKPFSGSLGLVKDDDRWRIAELDEGSPAPQEPSPQP